MAYTRSYVIYLDDFSCHLILDRINSSTIVIMPNVKSKLSCLLSICLLMGSCSGEVSTRTGDSGTSSTTASTPSTSGDTSNQTSSNNNDLAQQLRRERLEAERQRQIRENEARGDQARQDAACLSVSGIGLQTFNPVTKRCESSPR